MSGLFDDFKYVKEEFKKEVLLLVAEFCAKVVTVRSEEIYLAYATYELGNKPWLTIVSQDPTGEVTQINIPGNKAIDLLKSTT